MSSSARQDEKKKKILYAALVISILLLGVIMYETFSCSKKRSQTKTSCIPIWDSNQDFGFLHFIKTDALSQEVFPMKFPVGTNDTNIKEPKAYPAVFCKQCRKPFGFVTGSFSPGDKPESCPRCGNENKTSLIVLETPDKILDFGLRDSFNECWDDQYIIMIGLEEKLKEIKKKEAEQNAP